MEKTITLGGKELKLRSSLGTIITYRSTFGTELFDDVQTLDSDKKEKGQYGKIIDVLFRIVYVLHKPYTKESYEEFLLGFDFDVLSNTKELEDLSDAIGVLLGGLKKEAPGDHEPPQQ